MYNHVLSLLNRVLGVLSCFACLRACVLTCLACLRAYALTWLVCLRSCVFGVFACLRAWRGCVLACLSYFCTRVLNLSACYDACLSCSALAYSRFCQIIVFVCINQGFAVKRKLLIRVNLS